MDIVLKCVGQKAAVQLFKGKGEKLDHCPNIQGNGETVWIKDASASLFSLKAKHSFFPPYKMVFCGAEEGRRRLIAVLSDVFPLLARIFFSCNA